MKTRRSTLCRALITALVCFTATAGAQTLTGKQIKKFKGEYLGPVSGIASNTSRDGAVAFETTVNFTGKSAELLTPQISNLYASPTHRIVYRKPTGDDRRLKITGFYVGTAINPSSGFPEPVSGIRKMVITDRGEGKNVRFVMRFSDTLREGVYAAQDIKGTLGKTK
jgi:hypothetical protein